ncbi:MAG TPA: methyltransferase domain-containing protein [Polyangia bacterium]|nr:methyltransferase domain-containing protein [Polyangia bacterium]
MASTKAPAADERKRALAAMFERHILRDARSPVFREYCRQVHGVDRFQYNAVSAAHFEQVLQALSLSRGDTFLDVGCAAGTMTVEVARRTGARGVGIDIAPGVVELASNLAAAGPAVSFQVGDLDDPRLPPSSFDAIMALDTLYFARDLPKTVRDLLALLKPGGRLVALFSAFQGPDQSPSVLTAGGTALATALGEAGVLFEVTDLTQDDREHWKRAIDATAALKPAWEARGELDAWRARCEENDEIAPLVAAGRSARFLYLARTS